MNKVYLFFFLLLTTLSSFAQKDNKSDSDYYNYEVRLIDVAQDGTKLLTIWVEAKKLDEGVELAKRNAIAACLFKGVEGSSYSEKIYPIVPEGITAENKAFFDDFLKLRDKKGNGGQYLRFVAKTANEKSEKTKKSYKVYLDVQVSYDALRDYMVSQGKAKSLNFLF